MSTAKGKGKATTKSKAPEKASEERVQSGFQLLLGNGEALSKDVFLGFGAVNFLYDIDYPSRRQGQDLGRKLSWARWNSRESPADKVNALRDSILNNLEVRDPRVSIPIPVHPDWVSNIQSLVRPSTPELPGWEKLPLVVFDMQAMVDEALRPFGGNVSTKTIDPCANDIFTSSSYSTDAKQYIRRS
jgi:hypothetical protein